MLLKRGMSATIDELLSAAEYILAEGNPDVVLCERGIRTFETATRNTLDLSAVPCCARSTHLPIIVDPSHGVGVRRWIRPLCRAAKAVGANGILIEVHPNPAVAKSDAEQALTYADLRGDRRRSCSHPVHSGLAQNGDDEHANPERDGRAGARLGSIAPNIPGDKSISHRAVIFAAWPRASRW